MPDQQEKATAKEIGMRTGRDPTVPAAVGSVLLSWFQFYVRGNKTSGLFIGLWAPTLLTFSNALRINQISRNVESKTGNLVDWLTGS
jgi:hypothetical protein